MSPAGPGQDPNTDGNEPGDEAPHDSDVDSELDDEHQDEDFEDGGPFRAGDDQRQEHERRLRRTVTALTQHVQWMTARLDQIVDRLDALDGNTTDEPNPRKDQPAPWVLYSAPAAAEDARHRPDRLDARFTLNNFVGWYNTIYVGAIGTRAAAIPECWTEHPGLAQEIATLAYTWREANIGPNANARDAQQWHDRWRPGFAERLTTEWTHTHCRQNDHRPVGAPSRPTRYE